MTRKLSQSLSLAPLGDEARVLQRAHEAGDASAARRVEAHLPGHSGRLTLSKARTVIAREHGLDSWPELQAVVARRLDELEREEVSRAAGVPVNIVEQALAAVRAADRSALAELLQRYPTLLAVQVGRDPGRNLLHEACAVDPRAVGRSPADVIAIIDLLLASGLDVNAPVLLREGERLLPSWFCVRGGSLGVLEHVLARGGRPGGLFAAAYGHGAAALRLLRRYGADLEEVVDDETPLLHALKNRRLESARVLLELGADPNHADSQGATVLHYAVRQYHDLEVIALLLAHGASPDARTKRGATPLDVAVRIGRHDIATVLGAPPGVVAARPASEEVRLRPFVSVETAAFADVLELYRALGYRCDILLEDDFAALTLGEARVMLGADGAPSAGSGALIHRCPGEVFSVVAAAARSFPHAVEPHGGIRVEDGCGLELLFVEEPDRLSVALEPRLEVSDLAAARQFYEALGFEPREDANGSVTMHLQSARLQLQQAAGVAGRALNLWLTCDDFDGVYRRVGARMRVDPPQVAFHGEILFTVMDPDGRRVTFAGAATDI